MFADRHIGLDAADLSRMLDVIGVGSLDDLAAKAVPVSILDRAGLESLPAPASEHEALAELAVLADTARQHGTPAAKADLLGGGALLGLLQQDPEAWFKHSGGVHVDAAQVEALLEARRVARSARDFARADAIRDELAAMGVVIEDGAQGTRWSIAKA